MSGELEKNLRPRKAKSHLKKLGVKTRRIAAGSVNGGGIYVMDKPAGIEEGSVIIPLDSLPYRKFAAMMLLLSVPPGEAPDKLESIRDKIEDEEEFQRLKETLDSSPELQKLQEQIQNRYRKVVANFNQQNAPMEFAKLTSLDDQLEYLFRDEKLVKKRYGIKASDIGKALTTVGKLHEIESGTSYYVNEGIGGLLFAAYKEDCGIKAEDHFAIHIQKLIDAGNPVHMIKQDGEMVLGGSGPGAGRILKTGSGQKMQTLVHPGIVLATGGVSALLFGVGLAAWRGFYISRNTPNAANAEAIVESLSTKLADIRGFPSQEIDTIEGTYPDGSPKVCTIVGWTPGVKSLSGRLAGGESDYANVVVAIDPKTKQFIKVDTKGNILRVSSEDPSQYIGIDKEGKTFKSSKADYDKALAVSDDSIGGLGESLLSFICMGDRDGIGKEGQNKVIKPLESPRGNIKSTFFGIDFGKSYKGKNPIIDSLDDAFNFTNPSGLDEQFVNISILYDNPLREKMKGVYLLAALRGQLSPEEKEAIALDYEQSGDTHFANHLRTFPVTQNADLFLIKEEENKYRELARLATTKTERDQFTTYAQRISEVYKIAKKTDEKALSVFSQRMHLLPHQLDVLENLEKLTALDATTLSPDGKVRLNHIHVPKEKRTPWELESNEDGSFNLVCLHNNPEEIKQKLSKLASHDLLGGIIRDATLVDGKLKINNLSQEDMQILSENLTEDLVAKERELIYRSQEDRLRFNILSTMPVEKLTRRESLAEERVPETVIPLLSVEPAAPAPRSVLTEESALSSRTPRLKVEPVTDNTHPALKRKSAAFVPLHEGSPAKKPMAGYHFAPANQSHAAMLPLSPQPVIKEQGGSLKRIKAYLDEEIAKDSNQRTCHVIRYNDVKVNNNEGILVTFEKENKQTQALIEEDKTKDEITYSTDQYLSKEDFIKTAAEICQIAVQTAPLNANLDISQAPDDKKAILFDLFTKEIQKALSEGKFTEQNKPIIKGYRPQQESTLQPLFTASPRRPSSKP